MIARASRSEARSILNAVALVLLVACSGSAPNAAEAERAKVVIQTDDGTVDVHVEVADDQDERRTGLMGRTSLAPNAGMAFVFPGPTSGSFWMKDTLIPLSIAFWNGGGRIVAILDMEPCKADPCPSYDPGLEFAGALEVNQGFFEERGVEIGDRIRLVGLG